MTSSADLPCRELVELVTAYLDGALSPADRSRFDAHCRVCPGCRTYLGQMQLVVGAVGQLRDQPTGVPDPATDRLRGLFSSRGLHAHTSRERDVPLGIAGEFVAAGDHIGYFWESEEEFNATAGFLTAGVERDEVCILLGHDAANARARACLERDGFDPDDLARRVRLVTISGQQAGDSLLEEIGDRIRMAIDQGVPGVRILGHLGWTHPGWPSDREILRLEARVTEAVKRLPAVVVCAYDVRGLPGAIVLQGGLECHPLTLRRAILRRNEHHVPPERFLEALGAP